MVDIKVKQISEEAKRFIVTAANIPANNSDFAVVESYIAPRPVTIGLGQRLLSVLSLTWQLRLYLFLGWPISSAEEDLEEKCWLKQWQVLRLQMIRAFEHEPDPKRKQELAETLERFAMPIDEL